MKIDDHHTSTYLQLNITTRHQEENLTLYDCMSQYQDVQWSSVTCIKNDELWLSHKYYVNDMIMQSNMTMKVYVIITECWKLHGNISWTGYGNAMIARYGGFFEEDIRRLMCDRPYRITGFGCTGEVCTNSQGEKGQCTVPKRLAKAVRWECV